MQNKKTKILVIATSRKTRGGITSVIKAHEKGAQWEKYYCKWIQTHRDGIYIQKLLFLIISLAQFCILIPFYDGVHIHFSTTISAKRKYIFFIIAKALNKKTIIHLHCGSQLNEIWSPIYERMFKHADKSLVLSKGIKDIVEQYTGKLDDKICVLYNPCPSVIIDENNVKRNFILFAGSIIPDKGYKDLIQAFALIATKFKEWNIIFAGNGEIEIGKKLAKNLNIENQIFFQGWVYGETKSKLFQEASIFCLPSYAEGFPMAVLDAWAYGLPVITTSVGGLQDVLVDEENALIFTPGNIIQLSFAIEKLILNGNIRNSLANESIQLSNTIFNEKHINSMLEKIYFEVFN